MESLINQHWTIMGEYDRQHRVKLVVDEWGAWYKPGSEVNPTHLLGQQSTMRDAMLAGLTLDTFNRHADKVAMANVAQLINCLHSLFLAHEDKFIVTPTFHVFEMFMPHMGGRAVRAVFSAPEVQYTRVDKPAEFWGLSGSASVNGKQLTLTVTNPHLSEPRETEIVVRGARASNRSGAACWRCLTFTRTTRSRIRRRCNRATSRSTVSAGVISLSLPARFRDSLARSSLELKR